MPLDLPKLLRSFRYALRGLRHLIEREQNARIHLAAALLSVFLGIALSIGRLEWVALLLSIGMVISIETVNTAVEKLLDIVHPESHSQIAFIKDALAGAVLLSACMALAVAACVFLPHLIQAR